MSEEVMDATITGLIIIVVAVLVAIGLMWAVYGAWKYFSKTRMKVARPAID